MSRQGSTPKGSGDAQDPAPKGSGYQWAMRVGTEMVTATIIGVAIGYQLDRWLGTKPWLTLVFFLFGTAAGFLNLYRAVNPEAFSSEEPKTNEEAAPAPHGEAAEQGKKGPAGRRPSTGDEDDATHRPPPGPEKGQRGPG